MRRSFEGEARDEQADALFRRVGAIAFTRAGCLLAKRLAEQLVGQGPCAGAEVAAYGPARFAAECGVCDYGTLAGWTARHFAEDDALVFVGASGIAVRAIAPHVRDKFTDPAVVSIDEAGHICVPLLSGHVGGGNDLARAIAALTGGLAAVSTATDVNGLFAVDEWAARHGLAIVERGLAKRVASRLLEGGTVGYAADFDIGARPPASALGDDVDLGIAVSLDDACEPFGHTLHLVPHVAVVGVGCRRGAEAVVLERAVDAALDTARVSRHAVGLLASIDVKEDEPAIAALASSRGWATRFFTAAELAAVPGEFAASDFVRRTVGVDNVCERAAVAAGGRLVLGKQAHDGVTVAIAVCDTPPGARQ